MTPVRPYLLTGFLGSGKTTLLRRLLADPAFHDTAVIVNELGEIGLDHQLIAFSSDRTVILPGGCVCCGIREDIETALRELFDARDAGRIPPFSRIVIETTGIADPIPLLMTLQVNPLARSRLSRATVVTVVDGVLGSGTLAVHSEAQVQVCSADLIVLSKIDLHAEAATGPLARHLSDLNPWAPVFPANLLTDKLDALFSPIAMPERPLAAVRPAYELDSLASHAHRHEGIRSHSLIFDRPLDWTAFGVWITLLLHRYGNQVLRIKGLLDIDGLAGPTIFHSAQHLVHPPVHLDGWPPGRRDSRLVAITRDLDPKLLERSVLAFDRAARMAIARPDEQRPVGGGGTIAGRPIRRPSAPGWIKG